MGTAYDQTWQPAASSITCGKTLGKMPIVEADPFQSSISRGCSDLAAPLRWGIIFTLLWSPVRAQADNVGVMLTGYYESRYLLNKSKPVLEQAKKFELQIDALRNTWRIDDLTSPGRIAYVKDELVVVQQQIHKRGTNALQLEVSSFSDGYPMDLDTDLRLVWFTYCAGKYLFAHHENQVPLPYGDCRQDPEVHAYRIKVHGDPGRGSPEQVEFFADQKLLTSGLEQLSYEPPGPLLDERKRRLQSLLEVMSDADLAARFTVSAWLTNLNVPAVPRNWKLELYFRDQIMRVIEGSTDHATAINSVSIRSAPNNVQVRDMRARDLKTGVNVIYYDIHDGRLPTTKELKEFSQARAIDRFVMPPDVRATRAVFLTILALLFVVPSVLIFRARKKFCKIRTE